MHSLSAQYCTVGMRGKLDFLFVVIAQELVELHEHVRVDQLAGDELAVVETLAKVQHQFDVTHEDGILKRIVLFL